MTSSGLRVASLTHGVDIVDRRSFDVAKGEALGRRGRVGLRQDDDGDGAPRLRQAGDAHRRGRVQLGDEHLLASRGARPAARRAGDASRSCPRTRRRRSARGCASAGRSRRCSPSHGFSDVDDRVREAFAAAPAPDRRRVPAALPAPALGRPAAARRDRDRVRVQARPDRHGRADDGPRRDHAGSRCSR